MRPPNKNRNNRNKGGRKPMGNVQNRVYESAGPEGKVRGTPQQIIEKYMILARDAQTSGDRVVAENFLQHAEHYVRMLNASQVPGEERRPLPVFGMQARADYDDVDDMDDDGAEGQGGEQPAQHAAGRESQRNGDGRHGDQRPAEQRDAGPHDGERRRDREDRRGERRPHERRAEEGRDDAPRGEDAVLAPAAAAEGSALETIDPVADADADQGLVATPENREPEAVKPQGEPRRRRRRAPQAEAAEGAVVEVAGEN